MSASYKVMLVDPVLRIKGITLDALLEVSDDIAAWGMANLRDSHWIFCAGEHSTEIHNGRSYLVFQSYIIFHDESAAIAFRLAKPYT